MSPANFHSTNGMIRRGGSCAPDAERAVAELADQLGAAELNALIFFCAPSYDLEVLGRAIQARFDCPVVGCTTAGEILAPMGYLDHSLVGVGFATPEISLVPRFIPALADFADARDAALELPPVGPDEKQFGLLLVDGLSLLEERVVAKVHQHFRGGALVGGSAGDNLNFGHTHLYHAGRFHEQAALVAVFNTTLPFKTFQFQHFEPTETKLVITEAEVATRTVTEINGRPAAEEYARIVGLTLNELSPVVFAAHPVMLRIGGEYYVRSIQKVNPDGSLTFFCAIEIGLVLTLATSRSLPDRLESQLAGLARELPGLQLILGCDCILRRLELRQRQEFARIAEVLAPHPFVGFSTYGEQFGGIHVNQTLTGLAIGGSR